MDNNPTLSIGIPSYRRAADVARQVAELAEHAPDLPVTVIDDGPDDDVAAALAGFGARVTLHRHAQNMGYAATFAELIARCDTDYLLLSADDDLCDPDGLRATRALLGDHAPDFAATQFRGRADLGQADLGRGAIGAQPGDNSAPQGTTLRRGRDHLAPVSLADLRDASGHAPGLVYRAAAARAALPFLHARLAAGCYAARTYPQVLVVAHIALSGGRCLWLPAAPVVEGAAHPPALRGPDGQGYDSPVARLTEHDAFDAAFAALQDHLPAQATDRLATDRLAALRLMHRQDTYRRFMRALRRHHPDMVSDWISGSLHYARASLPRHLLNLWAARRARARAEALLRKDMP